MSFVRAAIFFSAIVLLLACALHSTEAEASKFNWRTNPKVREFLRNKPFAMRATEGPLGGLIDIIIDIILVLLDIILGGAISPLKAQMAEMQDQMNQMGAVMTGGK